MAFSIYSLTNLGLTEVDLLTIRDSALSDLRSGKVVTSVNTPGLSTTFQVYATPMELLRAASFALQQINPTLYGQPVINTTLGFTK